MKNLLAYLLLFFWCLSCHAQPGMGVRGGVNMCMMTGRLDSTDRTHDYWIPGPAVFGMFKGQINDIFSLRSELGYITIGKEEIEVYDEFYYGSRNYIWKWHINCAQLIMAVQADLEFKDFSCFFLAGNYFTRMFGGKAVYIDENKRKEYDYDWRKTSYHTYYGEDIFIYYMSRNFELGVYGGAGISKKFGKGKMDLDCRFGCSIFDNNNFEKHKYRKYMNSIGYKPYRNLNFSITLSYWYLFRSKRSTD